MTFKDGTGIKKRLFRYLLAILLLALCGYGLYQSAMRGSASAWYYQADFALNHWNEPGVVFSDQEYVDALTAVVKASQLDPDHPHYAHMVGRITHLGINFGYEQEMTLEDVKYWHLKAATLRPLWPEPWVDLVMLNNSMHGFTEETQYYMAQALVAGPYISSVTVAVVKVYLYYWDYLNEDEKSLMFHQLARTASESNVLLPLLKFADTIGVNAILCDEIKRNDLYAKHRKRHYYTKFCGTPIP